MTATMTRTRSAVSALLLALLILALLLNLPLRVAAAQTGPSTVGQFQLVSALNGLEPLSNGALANERARGIGPGELPGIRSPSQLPSVLLWDDFGSIAKSGTANTIITITGGGNAP